MFGHYLVICAASNTRPGRHGMLGFSINRALIYSNQQWLKTRSTRKKMGWGQVKHGHCACKSWTGAELSMKAMVGLFSYQPTEVSTRMLLDSTCWILRLPVVIFHTYWNRIDKYTYCIHNWRWQCFWQARTKLERDICTVSMCFSCVLRLPSSSLVLNPDAVHIWNFLQSASCWAFSVNDLHAILHQCRLDNIILSVGMGRLRYDAPITWISPIPKWNMPLRQC